MAKAEQLTRRSLVTVTDDRQQDVEPLLTDRVGLRDLDAELVLALQKERVDLPLLDPLLPLGVLDDRVVVDERQHAEARGADLEREGVARRSSGLSHRNAAVPQ